MKLLKASSQSYVVNFSRQDLESLYSMIISAQLPDRRTFNSLKEQIKNEL